MDRIINKIKDKRGEIIELSDDAFEKTKIKCIDGHIFDIYNNDIIRGEWCEICEIGEAGEVDKSTNEGKKKKGEKKEDYISSILRNLGIKYLYDDNIYYIPKINYILSSSPIKRENYKVIVYPEEIKEEDKKEIEIIQEKIWQAIKNGKEIDLTKIAHFLDKVDKENKENKEQSGVNIQLNLQENLFIGTGDSSSIIKYAPEPYPKNIHIAYGYIRVSTSMQVRDGHSLEEQEEKIFREAKYRGLYLAKLFIDKGISGKDVEHRRGVSRLMNDLLENDRKIWVITVAISRFARKTIDTLNMVDQMEKRGCHFIALDLGMDCTNPSGKMMLTMLASQAQFEREQTSERVKGTLKHLKDQGRLRSKPPFGWAVNPDRSPGSRLHIRNEEEQEVIQRIRKLRDEHPGYGITAFSDLVNKVIPPPRKSREWHRKNLKQLMIREGIKIEKENPPPKDIDHFEDVLPKKYHYQYE